MHMYKKYINENCWTRFGSPRSPIALSDNGWITISNAAELFGESKRVTYELVMKSLVKTHKGPKKAILFNLAEFTEWLSTQSIAPVSPIKERTYSLEGAIEKSGFGRTWIYKMAEKHNVTRIRINGRTHFCKREIDAMLDKVLPEYSEWISEEAAAKMLRVRQSDMLSIALWERIEIKPGGNTAAYSRKDVQRLVSIIERRKHYV